MDEGCLSIPGLHESVTRPTRIHVSYLDENLVAHDEWVDGYLARVMQHEFDHLEGVMYVDRLSAFRKQMINSKLRAIAQGKFRCAYQVKTRREAISHLEKCCHETCACPLAIECALLWQCQGTI